MKLNVASENTGSEEPRDTEAGKYLALHCITDQDLVELAQVGESLADEVESIIEDFYRWLPQLEEYSQFFPDTESADMIKALQARYWHEFFSAQVDESYVQSRSRVGAVHAAIGLSLSAYFASMNIMASLIFERMKAHGLDAPQKLAAVTKLMHLDSAIVVESLSEAATDTIRKQSEAIMTMSTPVTAIWDDILLLPIVGLIDSRRADDIMKAMLTRIRDTESTVFILDISGVAVVDTAVANHLIKMTRAARLMGCECIISGISPAIASTVVELGIDVGTVSTRSSLKDALSLAFAKTGAALVSQDGVRPGSCPPLRRLSFGAQRSSGTQHLSPRPNAHRSGARSNRGLRLAGPRQVGAYKCFQTWSSVRGV